MRNKPARLAPSPLPHLKIMQALSLVLGLGWGTARLAADIHAAEAARAAAAIPVKDFFTRPEVAQPQLSPDGTKIAFLFPLDGRQAVGVYDRASGQAHLVVRATNESFDGLLWKGDEHLIAYADYHGNLESNIVLTDLSGKHFYKLSDRYGVAGIVDARRFDPETIVAFTYRDDGTPTLILVNVLTGNWREVFRHPEGNWHSGYAGIVVDKMGEVRFAREVRDKKETLLYRDVSGKLTEIQSWPVNGYLDPVEDIVIPAEGRNAYGVTHTANDRGELRSFNTKTHQWGDIVFTPPEGEIDGVLLSGDRTKLQGVTYEDEFWHFHWFDPAQAALYASLDAAFPGFHPYVVSRSADEQVLLVLVTSDREPGAYYVLDRAQKTLALFKRRLPQLDSRLLRPMEPIAFTARDGLPLHGYVTRPWTALPGRPVPLVILPHGGPFGVRDSWGFDDEVQFLASRGYAVLQVNYRGSGGYGRAFLEKGKAQWGRAMQDDLTDGVKWAIAQGIADPKRVAIYGASYGGYAALAGVTLTPDLYRCAVNYAGPTDLAITFHPRGSDAYADSGAYDFHAEWVGPTKEYRDATSPIRFVDRIRVPTFHAYGKNDPIVDLEHWERLKRELTRRKKPFDFFIEKDQGHGFDRGKASIEFYARLEKFLAKNLTGP